MSAIATIADRFTTAQAWWIASELIRRHPHLELVQAHDPVTGAALVIHDSQSGLFTVQLSLAHGVELLGPVVYQPLRWRHVFAQESPHETVKLLEVSMGLDAPSRPVTTPTTLVYRLVAQLLASKVNDRHSWYVSNDDPETYGLTNGPHDMELGAFPTALETMCREFETAAARGKWCGFSQYWAVMRDVELVMLLDANGVVHTKDGSLDLMALYVSRGRNLGDTVVKLLSYV